MMSGDLLDGVIPLWPLVSAVLAAITARGPLSALFIAPVAYISGRIAFGVLGAASMPTLADWPSLIATLTVVEVLTLVATRFAMTGPVDTGTTSPVGRLRT